MLSRQSLCSDWLKYAVIRAETKPEVLAVMGVTHVMVFLSVLVQQFTL